MHAVYNYSGFVDLVTTFQVSKSRVTPDQSSTPEKLSDDRGQGQGKSMHTAESAVDEIRQIKD
jgi:hypothetical protein